jgi:hypothetical protein
MLRPGATPEEAAGSDSNSIQFVAFQGYWDGSAAMLRRVAE